MLKRAWKAGPQSLMDGMLGTRWRCCCSNRKEGDDGRGERRKGDKNKADKEKKEETIHGRGERKERR